MCPCFLKISRNMYILSRGINVKPCVMVSFGQHRGTSDKVAGPPGWDTGQSSDEAANARAIRRNKCVNSRTRRKPCILCS